VEGSFEHGNEHSGYIKCWKVLEWLHNWRFLKKGIAPLSYLGMIVKCNILKMKAAYDWHRAMGWDFCYNCRSHVASCMLLCSSLTVFYKRYHTGQSVGAFSSQYQVQTKRFPGNLYKDPQNTCKHFGHKIGWW
jgi:hypothetical protein